MNGDVRKRGERKAIPASGFSVSVQPIAEGEFRWCAHFGAHVRTGFAWSGRGAMDAAFKALAQLFEDEDPADDDVPAIYFNDGRIS